MKPLNLIRIVSACLLGAVFSSCAHSVGTVTRPGFETFKGQEFPFSTGAGNKPIAVLTISSFRTNGVELQAHPTSIVAKGVRDSISQFLSTLHSGSVLPSSAKGAPARIAVDFFAKENNHVGRGALLAGVEGGLTLGVLGNNNNHYFDYHVDSTLTVTRSDGQSRTYRSSGDAKTQWKQQDSGPIAARIVMAARSRAITESLNTIAAQMKTGNQP